MRQMPSNQDLRPAYLTVKENGNQLKLSKLFKRLSKQLLEGGKTSTSKKDLANQVSKSMFC